MPVTCKSEDILHKKKRWTIIDRAISLLIHKHRKTLMTALDGNDDDYEWRMKRAKELWPSTRDFSDWTKSLRSKIRSAIVKFYVYD